MKKPETHSETQLETQSETQSETQPETQSETQPETQSENPVRKSVTRLLLNEMNTLLVLETIWTIWFNLSIQHLLIKDPVSSQNPSKTPQKPSQKPIHSPFNKPNQ